MKARPTRLEPIGLATNDPEKELVLSEFELLGESLMVRVNVRSEAFAGTKVMIVDDIRAVVDRLLRMSRDLEGEARLARACESDEVVMNMNARGQLLVSGHLESDDGGTHKLDFLFQTDQTALVPFARELDCFLKSGG
jgi:hypothetical protein